MKVAVEPGCSHIPSPTIATMLRLLMTRMRERDGACANVSANARRNAFIAAVPWLSGMTTDMQDSEDAWVIIKIETPAATMAAMNVSVTFATPPNVSVTPSRVTIDTLPTLVTALIGGRVPSTGGNDAVVDDDDNEDNEDNEDIDDDDDNEDIDDASDDSDGDDAEDDNDHASILAIRDMLRPRISVPGDDQSFAFRTKTGMSLSIQGTMHDGCRTWAPKYASSIASSNVRCWIGAASGTRSGSAVYTPLVFFQRVTRAH